jgi:hypothetical protein
LAFAVSKFSGVLASAIEKEPDNNKPKVSKMLD